jgi:hypothetical protein
MLCEEPEVSVLELTSVGCSSRWLTGDELNRQPEPNPGYRPQLGAICRDPACAAGAAENGYRDSKQGQGEDEAKNQLLPQGKPDLPQQGYRKAKD